MKVNAIESKCNLQITVIVTVFLVLQNDKICQKTGSNVDNICYVFIAAISI